MANRTLDNDGSLGLVLARDASTLRPGELAHAEAIEYRIGSPHIYKLPGRKDTAADLGGVVQGICKLQYDTASDVLAALANGTVWESALSTTPSFSSSGLTGLDDEAVPIFCGIQDRWLMCNGVDGNYLREPSTPPTGGSGNWRTLGQQNPPIAPTYTSIGLGTTPVRPGANSGTYTNPTRAYDTAPTTYLTTYATGFAGKTHTFTISTNLATTGRQLYVYHEATSPEGSHGPDNPKFDVVDTTADPNTVLVEYSVNGGTTYTTLCNITGGFPLVGHSASIADGVDFSATNLIVRATCSNSGTHNIYDIRVSAGLPAASPYSLTYPIEYAVTEIYTDSDGVTIESNPSPVVSVPIADASAVFGITLALPTKINAKTAQFGIYRSVDTPGGGYPNLYRLDTIASTSTVWNDDFSTLPSTTPDGAFLSTLEVLYPDGSTQIFDALGPPPISKAIVYFDGTACYLPAAAATGSRLYYGLQSSLSPAGFEQVPSVYYLQFQTPHNDTGTAIAVTNGGKTLLMFFENYTMLVNFLPQASDPGGFDNRVKEYVSNIRGCAGPQACTEFTLPVGQTLVASVDTLGLWVTNGVNMVQEWSRDIPWDIVVGDSDLSLARLTDKPHKRRLELLLSDGREYHFFYGRTKQDGDGNPSPILSGPQTTRTSCKHYCTIGGSWAGFSGDSTSGGAVYLEDATAKDESYAHNSAGAVPYKITTSDIYIGGISKAHIVESADLKFEDGITKEFAVIGTFTRDSGATYTKTKTFNGESLYFHAYADRHRVTISDITATEAPPFVGYSFKVRQAGPARDR